jgi:hypothetical protein
MVKAAVVVAALGAIAAAMVGCGRSIDSGYRGVYYNWRTGTDTDNVLGEGFQWLAPWNKILLKWKGIEATMKLAESPNTKVIVVGSAGSGGMPLILGGMGK